MGGPNLNIRYRTYSARHNRTTPPLQRHHHRGPDVGHYPNPAKFATAAQQAASARAASIVSAHTAGQIVCIVTVLAADQAVAVAVALAAALT
jgi:hypothetical protein